VDFEGVLSLCRSGNDGVLEDPIVDRPSSVADGALPGGLDMEPEGVDLSVVDR
jgi:hypothetical protein